MLVAAVALLSVGCLGIAGAVVMEMRTGESKYKLMMKIFPALIGIGGVLLGIAL
jgi:uncharacterized protein (DUF1810 family)